jgi:hypothetical protein
METGNAGRTPFEVGFDDHADGKTVDSNPYWNGERTKLGAPKLSEDAREWQNGFEARAIQSRGRACSDAEIRAAASVDVTRFRRKSNRHYR